MFFVPSIYFSFTTRFCFVLFRFSHFVTTGIVVPFGPRKFLLLYLRPHTCSLWNLLQTRPTFHSNRYIRPIRVDEYAAQLFGPGDAARREEDDRGSERKRAIARDTMTHVEEGVKRMSVKAPIWCVILFLCFDFSFKFPFVIFRYAYNHLSSSSPFVLHTISRSIFAPHREFGFMILWLILQRVSSLITHCLVLPPKFHPLTIISFRVFLILSAVVATSILMFKSNIL